MALTISGTSNGKLGNLSLSASTGDILDSKNTTYFGYDLWRLNANFTVTGPNLPGATTVTGWERNDNSGFASATTLATTGDVALADLVAGKQFKLPVLDNDSEQFLRLVYTVTGAAATTGTITAGLVADMQTNS